MGKKESKVRRILDLYYQGWFIWQIAEALDITEAEVVAALGR